MLNGHCVENSTHHKCRIFDRFQPSTLRLYPSPFRVRDPATAVRQHAKSGLAKRSRALGERYLRWSETPRGFIAKSVGGGTGLFFLLLVPLRRPRRPAHCCNSCSSSASIKAKVCWAIGRRPTAFLPAASNAAISRARSASTTAWLS